MRVTDAMIFQDAVTQDQAANARLAAATAQVSSGLVLQHPGDDPSGAGLVVQYQSAIQQATAIGGAAGSAADELSTASGALTGVSNALSSLSQLAVQMASGTYSASDRAGAAPQAQQLLTTIVADLNVKVGNRYLFAGTADGTQPFDATGAYSGDTGVRQVEIAPGVYQASSVRADVALKGVGGGVDVMSAITGLVSALQTNSTAGIQAAIPLLQQGITQVAAAQSQAGASMDAFDTAVATSKSATQDLTTLSSKLTDADTIQAASSLALAQNALQASLTATSQSLQLSLLNYIK